METAKHNFLIVYQALEMRLQKNLSKLVLIYYIVLRLELVEHFSFQLFLSFGKEKKDWS